MSKFEKTLDTLVQVAETLLENDYIEEIRTENIRGYKKNGSIRIDIEPKKNNSFWDDFFDS